MLYCDYKVVSRQLKSKGKDSESLNPLEYSLRI